MEHTVRIAVVGDYDPGVRGHSEIDDALRHVIGTRHRAIVREWVATPVLAIEPVSLVGGVDGIWLAPAPYANDEGVHAAVRVARERGIPVLAGSHGCERVVHVLHEELEGRRISGPLRLAEGGALPDQLETESPNPESTVESRAGAIFLETTSRVSSVYGRWRILEEQLAHAAIAPAALEPLARLGLEVTGYSESGEVRVAELRRHPFFILAFFEPQLTSTVGSPAPLVRGLVDAAIRRRSRGGTPNGMKAVAQG